MGETSRPEREEMATSAGCVGVTTEGRVLNRKALAGSDTHAQPVVTPHTPRRRADQRATERGPEEGRSRMDTAAHRVNQTPVDILALTPWLSKYPDHASAGTLRDGFSHGFRIPVGDFRGAPVCKNQLSVMQNPAVAAEKIAKELCLGRIAGHFGDIPTEDFVCSPLGVVPKKEPGKFWPIHNLSSPKGASVNEAIDENICSMRYASFDDAVVMLTRLGPGALLAKSDIESAF